MPIIQYSPWQDAANVGQGLGDTLSNVLMRLPMLKQQAEMQRQRMFQQGQLAQQHGRLYGAETELAQARTAGVQQDTQAKQDKERHLGNFLNHMKLANDRLQFGLDPSEPLMIAQSELTAADPKQLGELTKTLLLQVGGAFSDKSKAFAAGSPQGASAGRLSLNQVNPLLGTQGAMQPGLGQTISMPQLGTNTPTQIQGPPKPFAPEHLGNVFAPFAREFAKPTGDTNVLGKLSEFMQSVGQGRTNAPQVQSQQQGEIPTFLDENQARAAGHGPGSVIRIQGVGVVRLE